LGKDKTAKKSISVLIPEMLFEEKTIREDREKDRDVCGRRSDVSLRPFDQRATESIRGNGIDAYPVERAFTHFQPNE